MTIKSPYGLFVEFGARNITGYMSALSPGPGRSWEDFLQKEEVLGNRITSKSFLDKYNKNNFFHECYYGSIYNYSSLTYTLEDSKLFPLWKPCIEPSIQCYIDGHPAKRMLLSKKRGLAAIFQVGDYYQFAAYEIIDYGSYEFYVMPETSLFQALWYLEDWEKRKVGIKSTLRYRQFLSGTLSATPATSAFNPVYYGESYFLPKMDYGLKQALSDAASHADGFHFSRLAAEIAVDGLVLQSAWNLLESPKHAKKAMEKAAYEQAYSRLWRDRYKYFSSRTPNSKMHSRIVQFLGSTDGKAFIGKMPIIDQVAICKKIIPSLYLGLNYGVSAPVREYSRLPGALSSITEEIGPLVGRSFRQTDVFQQDTRCTLQLGAPMSDRQFKNLSYLTKGGLSLDDLWELVPLSFVVDWILNLSALFEAGRASQIYSELPIQYATISTVFERTVDLPEGLTGDVHHRCYIRSYRPGDSLPPDVYSFDVRDIRGTLSIRNIDDAAALILNYIK